MTTVLRFLLLVLLTVPAAAQWANDPALASELSAGARSDIRPQVAATASGATYVAWLQEMEPISPVPNFGIFLQRLDPQGRPQWAAGGVMIDAGVGSRQDNLSVRVTPAGDVWVAYIDRKSPTVTLRLKRVNALGVEMWGGDGTVVTAGSNSLTHMELAVCDNGTAFVVWSRRPPLHGYMQRIDFNGQLLGSVIDLAPTVAGGTTDPIGLVRVAPDEVVVAWLSELGTAGVNVVAQKFSSDGSEMFVPGGALVGLGASGFLLSPVDYPQAGLVPDGVGGVFFSFPNVGQYLQHVDSNGATPWGSGGLQLHGELEARVVVDSQTGEPTFFARASGFGVGQIRAERYDLAGALLWNETLPLGVGGLPGSVVLGFDVVAVPGGTRLELSEGTFGGSIGPSICRSLFVGDDGVVDHARTLVLSSGISDGFTGGVATTVGPFGDVINVWSEGPAASTTLKRIRAQNITANDEFGPAAGAVSRNAGDNFDVYTATVEPLGGVVTLDLTVPAPSGLGLGLVVGYAGTDSFSFAGHEVLVDISGAELLHLSPQLGPDVQYVIPIPASPLLAGAVIHTQGLQLGAGVQLVLMNAQDLYLGL